MWPINNNQVASLTEEDIARIAERERRQEALKTQEQHGHSSRVENSKDGKEGASSTTLAQPGSTSSVEVKSAEVGGSVDSPAAAMSKPRLLMGVPVVVGPNMTKFLYVEVPKGNEEGQPGQDGGHGAGGFNVEEAAVRLCEDLHGKRQEGQDFIACVSSQTVALTSR